MKFTKIRNLLALLGVAIIGVSSYAVHSAIPLGGSIFPLTLIQTNPTNGTDEFNQLLELLNQQVAAFPPFNGNVVISATTDTNPLVQNYYADLNFTSSTGPNASGGQQIVVGTSNRKIYPAGSGFSFMASGIPVGTTGVTILCSPSLNKIASIPQAMLASNTPIGAFYSTTGGAALNSAGNITLGSAFVEGCMASDAVYVSTNNSQGAGTATDYFINFPYFKI